MNYPAPDGLRGSEGTFSLCTGWYVNADPLRPPRGGAAHVRKNAAMTDTSRSKPDDD